MIIRNTLVNILGKGISAVISLLITAILVRHLGINNYGFLMLAFTIVNNATIVEGFFGLGITRYIAYFNGTSDSSQQEKIIQTGLAVSMLQGIIATVVIVGIVLLTSPWLFHNLDSIQRAELKGLLLVFLIKFAIQICNVSLMRILEGYQEYKLIRMSDIVFSFTSLVSFFAFIHFFPEIHLIWIGFIYVVLEIFRSMLLYCILKWRDINLRLSLKDRESFRQLFKFGSPILIAKLMTFLAQRSDTLLIGIFLTSEVVAQFQVANQIFTISVTLIALLTSALLPAISQRAAQNPQTLTHMFVRGSRYVLYSSLVISFIVILSRSFFFKIWLGEGFEMAQKLTFLFMLQMILGYHQGISADILIGMNRHHSLGRIEVAGSILRFAITLSLIKSIGVYAILIAALVKSLLTSMLYTHLALRALNIKVKTFFRECLAPSWVIGIAAITCILILNLVSVSVYSNAIQVGKTVCISFSMALLFWFSILEGGDRKRILHFLKT